VLYRQLPVEKVPELCGPACRSVLNLGNSSKSSRIDGHACRRGSAQPSASRFGLHEVGGERAEGAARSASMGTWQVTNDTSGANSDDALLAG
jgi:hypothetical protein